MNLWARTLRQLAVLAVALFFFSCEDETSILGFKNPNEKFKVNYVDIPIESSVLLLDSIRTSNLYTTSETNRLLVGKYTDGAFGEVSATAFTQFFTTNTSKTFLKESAEYDSVSIELSFDFYSYGTLSATPQTISVHEVERELKIDSLSYYFNKSNTPYNPTPLGSKTFAISPDDFNTYIEDQKDTTISINFPLDLDFGQRIFDAAVKYRNSTNAADSAFVRFDFFKEFNGIAIVPENGDKIMGLNPATIASRIVVHYHDTDADSLELSLAFAHVNGLVNYNKIEGNRAATDLAALTQYSQPVEPDNLRYIQSGTGVSTRLDFKKFYEFVDADSNSLMIVNSAELHLGVPEPSSDLGHINRLSLRAIKGEGYLKKVADPEIDKGQYLVDSASVASYAGQLGITGSMFTPLGADGSIFTVFKSGSNEYYNGFFTLFAQQLFKKEEDKVRFRYFTLYPEDPQIGKSVNRLVFNKDNIKLRVFYTRPVQLPQ